MDSPNVSHLDYTSRGLGLGIDWDFGLGLSKNYIGTDHYLMEMYNVSHVATALSVCVSLTSDKQALRRFL